MASMDRRHSELRRWTEGLVGGRQLRSTSLRQVLDPCRSSLHGVVRLRSATPTVVSFAIQRDLRAQEPASADYNLVESGIANHHARHVARSVGTGEVSFRPAELPRVLVGVQQQRERPMELWKLLPQSGGDVGEDRRPDLAVSAAAPVEPATVDHSGGRGMSPGVQVPEWGGINTCIQDISWTRMPTV